MIKVLINGAKGRMGCEAIKAVEADPDLILAGTGHHQDLNDLIKTHQPEVVVDLTTAASAYDNTKAIIDNNVHPVIGTSGLLPEQIQELQQQSTDAKLGGLIVPNFSISAVLMMQLATKAAKYLPYVEIIEQHHEKKLDAPSGTAMKTAEVIAKARQEIPVSAPETELLAGARGATQNNIQIHSVRLPGIVAKQQVLFGGKSETLSIEHQSIHRESFMPGLVLACKKVGALNTLHYGLDVVLD